jgi:hypothetical protein
MEHDDVAFAVTSGRAYHLKNGRTDESRGQFYEQILFVEHTSLQLRKVYLELKGSYM